MEKTRPKTTYIGKLTWIKLVKLVVKLSLVSGQFYPVTCLYASFMFELRNPFIQYGRIREWAR